MELWPTAGALRQRALNSTNLSCLAAFSVQLLGFVSFMLQRHVQSSVLQLHPMYCRLQLSLYTSHTSYSDTSGLFSCRPHRLELSPGFHPGPDHQWSLSDVCLKRTCSLDTSAFSALEVLDDNRAYKFTYLLTTNSVKALKGTRRTDAGHGKSSFLEPIRTN